MKINGLNSLGFTPQPQQSGSGKAASGKSAFQEVLSQSKDSSKDQASDTKSQDKAQSQEKTRLQAVLQAKSQSKTLDKSPAKSPGKTKDRDQDVDSRNPQSSAQESVSETTAGENGASDSKSAVGSKVAENAKGASQAQDVDAKSADTENIDPQSFDAQNADAQSVDPNALPGQPNIPSLNGPIDRMAEGSNQNVLMASQGAKVPNGMAAQEESVDSLTRRVVWNDFLRKMKDELGVGAEEVLGAFTTLSDQDLLAPPAQVADKVVMAMGLNPQDQQIAKKFFTELVSKTKSKSLGEELATSQKQINLTLMSQREMMRKSMQRAIDRMNQNFFMPQGRPDATKEGMAIPGMMPVTGEEAALLGAQLDPMYTSATPNMQTLTPAQALEMQQAPLMAAQAPTQSQVQKNTVDEMVRNFMSPQTPAAQKLAAGEAAIAAPQAGAGAGASSASTSATSAAAATSAGFGSMLGKLSASGEGEESEDFLSDASYLQQPIGPESRFAGLAGASASDFKAELAGLNNNQPVAIPELVDRAQLMVHGGGGEMKVTLSPDGLGEVAMRVSVQDGKVSVQMITESDEAKKMIERQLSELKTGLSQNHLHVESIKIDTASNLGKQLEQQYQDAQRQMAHQTLEQFRQDHQGWRRSFFETPSSKSYQGQAEAPRDIRAPSNNKAKGARRLDLVA